MTPSTHCPPGWVLADTPRQGSGGFWLWKLTRATRIRVESATASWSSSVLSRTARASARSATLSACRHPPRSTATSAGYAKRVGSSRLSAASHGRSYRLDDTTTSPRQFLSRSRCVIRPPTPTPRSYSNTWWHSPPDMDWRFNDGKHTQAQVEGACRPGRPGRHHQRHRPDFAVNHDPEALCMHLANHPDTVHYQNKITTIDPLDITKGKKVGLLWCSPDCRHHSKAKGGKPVEKNIRDLAWVVVHWAERARPRVICMENVEEFKHWGPLDEHDRPIKERRGEEFTRWVGDLKKLGYAVEWRELVAADYGVPTTRKRLFIVARCDGRPIVWPAPTHANGGEGGLLPWRSAAECIDWSIPSQSIFTRAEAGKPELKPATLARVAKGIFKFVLNNPRPFIVPLTHQGPPRAWDVDEPFRTVTGASRGEWGGVQTETTPTFNGCGGRAGQSRPRGGDEPLHTITSKGDTCVTSTELGTVVGYHRRDDCIYPADEPLRTQDTSNRYAVVQAPFGVPRYGERPGQEPRTHSAEEPMPVVVPTGNGFQLSTAELTAAFLAQHNSGFNTTHARDARDPLSTTTATGSHQQPVAVKTGHVLIQRKNSVGRDADEPSPTSCAHTNHLQVVEVAHLEVARNNAEGRDIEDPTATITATGNHHWVVTADLAKVETDAQAKRLADEANLHRVLAFLLTYYSTDQDGNLKEPLHTITTRDRFGVVTVRAATVIDGMVRTLDDILMRMLEPKELFLAQGFPPDYIIAPLYQGPKDKHPKPLSKKAQTRMCGNSVPPGLAKHVVSANFTPIWAEVAA